MLTDNQKTAIIIGAGPAGLTAALKDQASAQIQEKQRHFDPLDAQFHLYKSEVYLLRHSGELSHWYQSMRNIPPGHL